MRRTLTWLVTMPFAAASVLLGHAIAYRATGAPAGDVHGYLEHAPQIVVILASIAVVGLAADTRARRHSPAPLAAIGAVAFVVQEHLERLVHTGQLPFLLTSPVLWLGVALQLPLAAVVWLVSRRVAEDIARSVRRAVPRLARLPLVLAAAGPVAVTGVARVPRRGRGPPPAPDL
jgi:hypothetical protein